ncbi:MAG: hypothetical protein H7339_11995 [Arcicella sp.]|nr:hypothetical protein [Arcicella sp.]
MRLIKTVLPNEIWESEFEGKTVQFIKNVFTNEISVNASQFAQCIGYKSLDEMMMDDNVLDACNDIHKETGIFPISVQTF